MKKSNNKSKSTKSSEKAKEPLLSTGKKIGLTVYFTFVFTLMGIMGLQIWMNSMNTSVNNESITSPQVSQNSENPLPEDPTINNGYSISQNGNMNYTKDNTQTNQSTDTNSNKNVDETLNQTRNFDEQTNQNYLGNEQFR